MQEVEKRLFAVLLLLTLSVVRDYEDFLSFFDLKYRTVAD